MSRRLRTRERPVVHTDGGDCCWTNRCGGSPAIYTNRVSQHDIERAVHALRFAAERGQVLIVRHIGENRIGEPCPWFQHYKFDLGADDGWSVWRWNERRIAPTAHPGPRKKIVDVVEGLAYLLRDGGTFVGDCRPDKES